MSMRIVYRKNFEGHKAGESGVMERTRAVRLMDTGVVEPWMVYQKRMAAEKAVAIEKEAAKKAEIKKKPVPKVEESKTEEAEEAEEEKQKPKKPRGRPKKTEKAVKL